MTTVRLLSDHTQTVTEHLATADKLRVDHDDE